MAQITVTAESIPDLDDWGWDDYWTCSDWQQWHVLRSAAYGKAQADVDFLYYWNQQSMGAHALDCRSFSTSFRSYFQSQNLLEALYDGALGVIASTIGAGTDVITGISSAVSSVGDGVKNSSKIISVIIPILLVLIAIAAIYYAYKHIK